MIKRGYYTSNNKSPLKLSSCFYLLQNWQVYDQVNRENLLFRHEKQSWERSGDEKEESDGICHLGIVPAAAENPPPTFPFFRAA